MRIAKYLNENELKIIKKTFIQSQFNYCPLVWMFHYRTINYKINKLHDTTFQELLNKDNSVTTHDRNLQRLATEMYKIKNHLSPLPMQELYSEKVNKYDLRNNRTWESHNVRTASYGTEAISNMGPKTCDLVPIEIKESTSLKVFTEKI